MKTFQKIKKFIKHNKVRVFTFVLTLALLCSSSVCVFAAEQNLNKTIVLGSATYDNYRGYIVGAVDAYRPYNMDIYYAPGQDRVRVNTSYPYLDYTERPQESFTPVLVNSGYHLDFNRSDASEQGFGLSLPLCTGLRWDFTSYLSNIQRLNESVVLWQTRVVTCEIRVFYRLYDTTGGGDEPFPSRMVVKRLTDKDIELSMGTSSKFEQNSQSTTFGYSLDFNFTRPVMIEALEVRFVYQLYSDYSNKDSILERNQMLYQDLEAGMYELPLRQLGYITDFGFPTLKGYYNSGIFEEFIALGTSADFTQYVLDSYHPIDRVESLTLLNAVDYAGNALILVGSFIVGLVQDPFLSALIGGVLTFSVISAFIGVAVWFGKRKKGD